jgi:dihydrofolate reductase
VRSRGRRSINAELVRGDLGKAVQQLKQESGKGLFVGGVTLPLALAELGFIDEYEFIVHPRLAGHGPPLFAGLSKPVAGWSSARGRWRCGMSREGRSEPDWHQVRSLAGVGGIIEQLGTGVRTCARRRSSTLGM